MGNLIAAVVFPTGTGIQGIVFGLLRWLYKGFGDYGLTIIFFTLVLKTIMLPLDFGYKFFTKKNTLKMAEFKPEEDKLKELYKSDPMALNRERSALYKKHGYSQGGFCLFSIINLVLTLVIFLSVFNGLRAVSNYNISEQFKELQGIYQEHKESEGLDVKLNEAYEEVRFLWVKNIWRPDGADSRVLTFEQFESATKDVTGTVFKNAAGVAISETEKKELENQYNEIFGFETKGERENTIVDNYKGWNGLFLLVLLAGATTYLSTLLNSKIMARKSATKTVEQEAVYSIRDAKVMTDPSAPQFDPQSMNKIMKYIMPAVMIFFTISTTAALALYIIMGSIIGTLLTLGSNFFIDKIISRQEKKEKNDDTVTINPHAKYFKGK